MGSVNKIILLGNLGADPEVRHTPGGQAVCNLRVATNERWKDRDGQLQDRTEWHSVTVWGQQGEACGAHLSKGRQVYVEGRLQTREYADRDGNACRAVEIVANSVVFIGGDGGGQRQSGPRGQAPQQGGGGWG